MTNPKITCGDTEIFNQDGKENEEYDVVEIKGKHSIIHLHVPKREPTQEEVDELYKTVAEVVVNTYKKKKGE